MGLFFYRFFLLIFHASLTVAALFSEKARKWKAGRKDIWQKLRSQPGSFGERDEMTGKKKIIWMHCASLGEFEQGRPLLEKLKHQYPTYRILLTFFSPSGYEVRKKYAGADWVFYLPLDGPSNARQFLSVVEPAIVVFVKYEFWFFYLREIHKNKIPLLLVSAIFRKNSIFFKSYGQLQRKMLSFFNYLFVQDEKSLALLASINVRNAGIAGDTRFDRVIEIAEQFRAVPGLDDFIQGQRTIVAGSTWPQDEVILQKVHAALSGQNIKLIIAPHEIGEAHINQLRKELPQAILYSSIQSGNMDVVKKTEVLIIDNIGMLSKLYRYAWVTYIGGGFGKGIHNTLEAAVYGKPVLFGPVYQKFREAIGLVANGGAFEIRDETGCLGVIDRLKNDNQYEAACNASADYVRENQGATGKILNYIQENRLLTN